MKIFKPLYKHVLPLLLALVLCLGMLPGMASAMEYQPCPGSEYGDSCIWMGNVQKTPATCTEPSKTELLCATCGRVIDTIYKPDEEPALGHKWDEGKVTTEATATTDGVKTFTCQNDPSHTRTESIPATGKCDWCIFRGDVRHEPATCTEPGKTVQLCANCGSEITTILEPATEPALGHSWGDWIVTTPATETADGEETRVCTRCSEPETRVIPATGHTHTWGDWTATTPAACTADGEETRVCTCGETETRSLSALGHSWGGWIVTTPATETADGEETRTCTRCSEMETRAIPATGMPTPPTDPVTPIRPSPDPVTPPTTIPDTPTPLNPGETINDQEVPLAGTVGLNNADHFAYIIGYDDDTVRPLGNITRAEAVTIFFRLMTEEYRTANWSTENSFSDVNAGSWYNNAVSTVQKAGALEHFVQDGVFLPNQAITRAEFASIAAGFVSSEITGENVGDFSDTEGHWAAEAIRKAVGAGWITGKGGNTFAPDEHITRAEVMTIVNRMLDRTPDKDHMLPEMKKWTDNPEDAWYYEAVQEATNEHAYTRDENSIETWTVLKKGTDWAALELGWAAAEAESKSQEISDGI